MSKQQTGSQSRPDTIMQRVLIIPGQTFWSKAILAIGALYLVLPADLIADSNPLGFVDDAMVVPLLITAALMIWPRKILSFLLFSLQTFTSLFAMLHATTAQAATPQKARETTVKKMLSRNQLIASGAAGSAGVLPPSIPSVPQVPGAGLAGPPGPLIGPSSDFNAGQLPGESGMPLLYGQPLKPAAKAQKWTTQAGQSKSGPSGANGGGTTGATTTPGASPGAVTAPGVGPSPTLLQSTVSTSDRYLGIVDALDEALLKSPRAAAIRANLGIARSNLAYATVQRNSSFFFDRGLVAEAERRIGPTFTWTPPWQTAFDLLVAKRQVEQAKLEILRDLWQLRSDVRRSYTEVVVAQEVSSATQKLVELAARTTSVTRKRFQAGAVPEFDLLKAQLSLEQAELDLKPAQQRVIKAKQKLNLLLGRMPKNDISIPSLESADSLSARDPKRNYFLPDLSEAMPDLNIFLDQAKKCRWDLTALGQQIKVNKAQLLNAYGSVIPAPQLIMGQSVSGNVPTGPKLTANFFTINAELPTTNLQQGDIAKYRATGRQLKWQMEATKNTVYSEICDAYNDLITYRERIRLYKEHVLGDSLETARLSRRSYEAGRSDITSVIQSQQDNFQVQLQYLADVLNYQQAFIALEQATGRPLQ